MSPYERMAWDFSTEPEFQRRLDRMAELVREHVPTCHVAARERSAGLLEAVTSND